MQPKKYLTAEMGYYTKLQIKLNYYNSSGLYFERRKMQNAEQKCPCSHNGRVKLGSPILSEQALRSRDDGPTTLLLLSPGQHPGNPFWGMRLPTLVSKVFTSKQAFTPPHVCHPNCYGLQSLDCHFVVAIAAASLSPVITKSMCSGPNVPLISLAPKWDSSGGHRWAQVL